MVESPALPEKNPGAIADLNNHGEVRIEDEEEEESDFDSGYTSDYEPYEKMVEGDEKDTTDNVPETPLENMDESIPNQEELMRRNRETDQPSLLQLRQDDREFINLISKAWILEPEADNVIFEATIAESNRDEAEEDTNEIEDTPGANGFKSSGSGIVIGTQFTRNNSEVPTNIEFHDTSSLPSNEHCNLNY